MALNAYKNRMVQFYIASAILFVALAVVGSLFSDRWREIAKHPLWAESYQSAEHRASSTFVDLPRMTVSLGNGPLSQISVDISFEIERKDVPILEGYMPQIMDRFNLYLPRVNPKDVSQPAGMTVLRRNLKWQVDDLGMPIKVQNLFVQNLMIR